MTKNNDKQAQLKAQSQALAGQVASALNTAATDRDVYRTTVARQLYVLIKQHKIAHGAIREVIKFVNRGRYSGDTRSLRVWLVRSNPSISINPKTHKLSFDPNQKGKRATCEHVTGWKTREWFAEPNKEKKSPDAVQLGALESLAQNWRKTQKEATIRKAVASYNLLPAIAQTDTSIDAIALAFRVNADTIRNALAPATKLD
jgi:hypothetical protein